MKDKLEAANVKVQYGQGRGTPDDRVTPDMVQQNPSIYFGLMHHKMCIVDSRMVLIGSFNPTNMGAYRNRENVALLISHPDYEKCLIEFTTMWAELGDQEDRLLEEMTWESMSESVGESEFIEEADAGRQGATKNTRYIKLDAIKEERDDSPSPPRATGRSPQEAAGSAVHTSAEVWHPAEELGSTSAE